MSTNPKEDAGFLTIRLESVPSTLQTAPGGEINFPRAVLFIDNTGHDPLTIRVTEAILSQEGGLPQDVSKALNKNLTGRLIPSGDSLRWDLYDLLLTDHPGVSSKVHLFGYKAVLNWWFELGLMVEYRLFADSLPVRMPLFRGKFRWNASKTALEKVELVIDHLSS